MNGLPTLPPVRVPPEFEAMEFHWLTYVGTIEQYDLWRWHAGAWCSITVPGVRFSPEELGAQHWRYNKPAPPPGATVKPHVSAVA